MRGLGGLAQPVQAAEDSPWRSRASAGWPSQVLRIKQYTVTASAAGRALHAENMRLATF